jgi:hypothetical protein
MTTSDHVTTPPPPPQYTHNYKVRHIHIEERDFKIFPRLFKKKFSAAPKILPLKLKGQLIPGTD